MQPINPVDADAPRPEPTYIDETHPETLGYPLPPSGMPEAGGVAYVYLYAKNGAQVSITERRSTAREALDALVVAVDYALKRYGWTTQKPAAQTAPSGPTASTSTPAPAPSGPAGHPAAPAPASGVPNFATYQVLTVKHIKSKNQKHMVVVTLDGFSEGVFAYDKVMPDDSWKGWTLFEEYGPPVYMAYAQIDTVKKVVTAFKSQP